MTLWGTYNIRYPRELTNPPVVILVFPVLVHQFPQTLILVRVRIPNPDP